MFLILAEASIVKETAQHKGGCGETRALHIKAQMRGQRTYCTDLRIVLLGIDIASKEQWPICRVAGVEN